MFFHPKTHQIMFWNDWTAGKWSLVFNIVVVEPSDICYSAVGINVLQNISLLNLFFLSFFFVMIGRQLVWPTLYALLGSVEMWLPSGVHVNIVTIPCFTNL